MTGAKRGSSLSRPVWLTDKEQRRLNERKRKERSRKQLKKQKLKAKQLEAKRKMKLYGDKTVQRRQRNVQKRLARAHSPAKKA